jgi:hypothetical protein
VRHPVLTRQCCGGKGSGAELTASAAGGSQSVSDWHTNRVEISMPLLWQIIALHLAHMHLVALLIMWLWPDTAPNPHPFPSHTDHPPTPTGSWTSG